jgi:hypothetical protein
LDENEGRGLPGEGLDDLLGELLTASPQENPAFAVRAVGFTDPAEPEDVGIRVFLFADVLRELRKAAVYREESAVAVLTGQIAFDPMGPFVEVTGFQELNYLFGGDPVTVVQPVVEELLGEGEEFLTGEGPEREDVVGLFCARPGSQGELDEGLVRLHLTLFNRVFQVVLVMDGPGDQLGLFVRFGWEPFVNVPFFVVEDAEQQEEHDDEPETEPKTEEEQDERDSGAGGQGDPG